MRLVLTHNRLRLLQHVDAGRVSLDNDGEAVLKLAERRPKKVTGSMDEFEQFGLVHATIRDRTYTLTSRGEEVLNKAIGEGSLFNFICSECVEGRHDNCKTCDCQHRVPEK